MRLHDAGRVGGGIVGRVRVLGRVARLRLLRLRRLRRLLLRLAAIVGCRIGLVVRRELREEVLGRVLAGSLLERLGLRLLERRLLLLLLIVVLLVLVLGSLVLLLRSFLVGGPP